MLPRAAVDVAVRVSDAAAADVAAEPVGAVAVVDIGVYTTLQPFQKQQSNMDQNFKAFVGHSL